MARLRPGRCYRRLERPYTRVSRKREKSFIKTSPHSKVVHYNMGKKGDYSYVLKLVSKSDVQIRHNAIEAARIAVNKVLESKLSGNYYFWIKIYPHHIIRENPLATGAGADRFQTGMKHAFGKPKGRAAQVKKGKNIMEVYVNKDGLDVARMALKRGANKLPGKKTIIIENNINPL